LELASIIAKEKHDVVRSWLEQIRLTRAESDKYTDTSCPKVFNHCPLSDLRDRFRYLKLHKSICGQFQSLPPIEPSVIFAQSIDRIEAAIASVASAVHAILSMVDSSERHWRGFWRDATPIGAIIHCVPSSAR
jgi:hypothetical protein